MLWNSLSYVWNRTTSVIFNNVSKSRNLHTNKKVGYLYAFHLHGDTYKVGKTVNLDQRVRPYKTVVPKGYVFHRVECVNIDSTEKILHYLLKLSGHHSTKEIFILPGNVLKEYMNIVAALEKTLIRGDDNKKLSKIAKFIDQIN
jgi:hypothetical protein